MSVEFIEKHKFIIFCGHGINALGIIRSLHEKQIVPNLILYRNTSINYVDCCRFVGRKQYVENSHDGLELLLNEYGNEEFPPFVFTCDDYHNMLLDQNYKRLLGRFHFYNCGADMRLTLFQNKDEQCKAAAESGFAVPAWEVVQKGVLPTTLRYPIITKTISPYEGMWKKDVFVCRNEDDLINAYDRITADRLLLEEYVNKKCEVTLHGLSIGAGNQVYIPFYSEDYCFSKTGFGNYLKFQSLRDPTMLEHAIELVRKLKFSGLFGIDMVVDNVGKLLFLEINMRSDARNYATTAGGANLPYLWAKTTVTGSLPDDLLLKEKFYVVDEIGDLMDHKKNLGKWFVNLRKADVYIWHYKHDNRPICRYIVYKMKRIIKKFFAFAKS